MEKSNGKLIQLTFFIIFIQLLSFIYIIITDNLNGDYYSFQRVNTTILTLSFISSIIPFIWVRQYLTKKKDINSYSLANFKYYNSFIIILLLIDIFLSVNYKVGRLAASEIYNVPFYLKPLVVLINRIDIYILSGFLLISNFSSKKIKIVVIVLLIIFSLSRASVYVFLFLILIYIGSTTIKLRFKNIFLITTIIFIIFYIAPLLFSFRESLRHDENFILINNSLDINSIDFIIAKLLGRVSNLSSIVYFHENIDVIAKTSSNTNSFGYIIEFFKPIWGAFISDNYTGYTYYFTNIFDPYSDGHYGIMYGLPTVLTLSYFKGLHVFILNFTFIVISIYYIILNCRNLFGDKFIIYSFILLIGPIMSGVSPEFGMLLLNLIIIRFFKGILMIFKN